MDDINGDPRQTDPANDPSRTQPEPLHAPKAVSPQNAEPSVLHPPNIVKDDEEEASVKTKNSSDGITSGEKDILDRIKAGEKWMIAFTAIVAFMTVAQFFQSGCNNRATSNQTDKIIDAANIQACAATKNAKAAGNFSLSADGINRHTSEAVAEFARQAKASERAAQAAQAGVKATQEAMRADQRAWVGAIGLGAVQINLDEIGSFEITLTNSGKSPAIHSHIQTTMKTVPLPSEDTVILDYPPARSPDSDATLQPGTQAFTRITTISKMTKEEIQIMESDRYVNLLYGQIDYFDAFSIQRRTEFCIRIPGTPTISTGRTLWQWCDRHNTAN